MTTLLTKGPGPDKRFEMSERTSAERTDADSKSGEAKKSSTPPD